MCEGKGVRIGMMAEGDTVEAYELIEEIKRGKVLTTIVGTDGTREQEDKARELCGMIGRQGGYWVHCDRSKRKVVQGRKVGSTAESVRRKNEWWEKEGRDT